QIETAWRSPDDAPLLTETQGWTFQDAGETYTLDLDWRLRADVDLTFEQYPYGGLFLRMPYSAERGGSALNSEGRQNGEAAAQPAHSAAVLIPPEGRTCTARLT